MSHTLRARSARARHLERAAQLRAAGRPDAADRELALADDAVIRDLVSVGATDAQIGAVLGWTAIADELRWTLGSARTRISQIRREEREERREETPEPASEAAIDATSTGPDAPPDPEPATPSAALQGLVLAHIAAGPISGREIARRIPDHTRGRVHEALDALRAAGRVELIGAGGRYARWALPGTEAPRPLRADPQGGRPCDGPIREAHARGLTVAQIVAETGSAPGTVRARLAVMGLAAHRAPRPSSRAARDDRLLDELTRWLDEDPGASLADLGAIAWTLRITRPAAAALVERWKARYPPAGRTPG